MHEELRFKDWQFLTTFVKSFILDDLLKSEHETNSSILAKLQSSFDVALGKWGSLSHKSYIAWCCFSFYPFNATGHLLHILKT